MTMTSNSVWADDAICKMCGNTFAWHKEMKPRHPFMPKDSSERMPLAKKDQKEPKVKLETREWPADPILRIALMDKGILTMADIIAAEQKLREAASNGGVIRLNVEEQSTGAEANSSLGTGDSAS